MMAQPNTIVPPNVVVPANAMVPTNAIVQTNAPVQTNANAIVRQLIKLGYEKMVPDVLALLQLFTNRNNMLPDDVIREFLDVVITTKDENKKAMLLRMARFPGNFTIHNFDFNRVEKRTRQRIHRLTNYDWVANGENVLLSGPSGMGKTHIAVALGRQAIAKGYSTCFIRANEFFAKMLDASRKNQLCERMKLLDRNQLIIIDDIGHSPHNDDLSAIFYELVSIRYQRKSILLTTNKTIDEWITLGNPTTVKAAVDRLTETLNVVPFKGKSYRGKRFKDKEEEIQSLLGEETDE